MSIEAAATTYRVVFRNAISHRGEEIHDRDDYAAALRLATTHWPFNNTRINILHIEDGREIRNEQICPDPEHEQRERAGTEHRKGGSMWAGPSVSR